MIYRLLKMEHPIINISFGKVFKFEFHPKIIEVSKTDEFMSIYWFSMQKLHNLTERVFKAQQTH